MRTTLLEIAAQRGHDQPSRLAYRFLRDGTAAGAVDCSYGELMDQVATLAAGIRERGVEPGGRVVIALDPGLGYVAALFAIFAAGATAVPAFPPDGRRTGARFGAILADCRPDLVVAGSRLADRAGAIARELPPGAVSPGWWLLDDAGPAPGETAPLGRFESRDPALIQYTSGSTGDPKGVVLTHANLIGNCRALEAHAGREPDRVGCSWLPPYHDMGLIGTILFAVYGGWPLIMLSPLHMVQRPYRWLKAITDHAATITVGPNFSFELCAEHISEEERAQLDLSSLRQIFCGSETVQAGTLERFRARFADRGYDERALIPCYGLAEATLFVAGKPAGAPVRKLALDTAALARGAIRASRGEGTAIVSCGRIAEGHLVLIADGRGGVAAPGQVGEIYLQGPSVAAGYLGRPEESEAVLRARLAGIPGSFLRTGDLGFLEDGELFVTGRAKDLIVIAGRNLYPQDIERSVRAADPRIRLAAAFGAGRPGAEELIVVAEYRGDADQFATDARELRASALAAVVADHGVRPAVVAFTRAGGIATTTSGKLRRQETRRAYLEGDLPALAPAAPAAALAPAAAPAPALAPEPERVPV